MKRYRVKHAVGPHDDRLAKAVGYCVALGEPDSMLLVEVSPYVWDDFARQGDRSKTGAFARDPKEAALRHGVGGRLVMIRAAANTKDITARGSKFSVAIAECTAPVISEPLVDLEELDPTEHTDSESDELSNFLGDLEALIPEDCRNTRPDRLASVRSAVGMMAQRLAEGEAAAATAQPGTGAWSWEQMQRGSEVWVRRRESPVVCYHMKHSGLIENSFGGQFNGVEPKVLEQMWPVATDWELCAAPGSKEAKRAEFHALAASAPETPLTAPSAKDGPTEEQVKQWRAAMWGKQVNATPSDWEELSSELRRTFCGFAELCWQAAREGMVPRSEYESADSRADENLARAKRAEDRADSAERRVGELESEARKLASEAASLREAESYGRTTADNLRAELERVKAELPSLRGALRDVGALLGLTYGNGNNEASPREIVEAARPFLTPASDEVTELAEWRSWANARLEQFGEALSGSDTESRDFITALLTPANEDETEEDLPDEFVWALMEAAHKANGGDSRDNHGEYSRHLIRLARRNHGAQPSSNPLQLPLTEAQREELAKELRNALMSNAFVSWEKLGDSNKADYLKGIDAIAPRIARMGVELRELSDAEVLAVINTRETQPGETIMQLFRSVHNAILAAAQGGETKPVTVIIDPYCPPRHEYLIHDPEGLVKSPRGRKLTDGERKQLGALIRAWDECHNPDELEQHWDAILTFVESLLAPQELETPRKHTPFSELFHKLWGQAASQMYDKALWVQLHELITAPSDEIRIELGELKLSSAQCWHQGSGPVFTNGLNDRILSTLSASPGDKFEFSVVARRVA